MAAQLPGIPLFRKVGVLVYESALVGLGPNPGVSSYVWNVEDWHWKR